MSELTHGESGQEPYIAPVIPLQRSPETDELLDFSEIAPDEAIECFISKLNHPSQALHVGPDLANDIDKLVPARSEKSLDPISLENRLVEIVRQKSLHNDEIYEHKAEHDEVFKALVEVLFKYRDNRSGRAQYEAARDLAELRSVVSDTTAKDDHWFAVIERLFRKQ